MKRTLFGFPPDYIPFPALDPTDVNGFEKMLAVAKDQVATAADKEALALDQSRDFDTDAEAFQSELVAIRQNYETLVNEFQIWFESGYRQL